MNFREHEMNEPRRGAPQGLVLKGLAHLFIGRIGTLALGFISTAILARLLTPADYGLMAAAMVVLALSNAIFEGAFGIGVVQKREIDDTFVTISVTVALVLAGSLFVLVAATAPLVALFFRLPELTWVLIATASSLLLNGLNAIARALCQRHGRFARLSISSNVANLVGYCIIGVAMAFHGFGVWSLVAAAVSTAVIELAINLAGSGIPLRLAWDRATVRDVARTSGWFSFSQVLNWAALTGANTVIGRSLGTEPLGLYSRGWKILDIAMSATGTPINRVLFPAFARLQEDAAGARKAFQSALAIATPVFGALSVLVVLHAEAVVRILLGPQWLEAVPIVQVLFLALLPRCSYKISESLAFGYGRSFAAMLRQAIYSVLMIGGAIVGALYGAAGVALSSSITIWIFYAISIAYAARLVRVPCGHLLTLHLRTAVLVGVVAVVDICCARALVDAGFWTSQLVSASAGSALLLLILGCAPESVVGIEVAQFRGGLRARLSEMSLRRRRSSSLQVQPAGAREQVTTTEAT